VADVRGLEALGRQYSKKLGALGQRVEDLLNSDERARVLAQARLSGRFSEFRDKGGLLLVLTDTRLVAVGSDAGTIVDSFPLDTTLNLKWEPPNWHPARLTATSGGESRVYQHVLPIREAGRIFQMATKTFAPESRSNLPPGFPPESEHPLVGVFAPGASPKSPKLYLYRDRVVVTTLLAAGGDHYPFTGEVIATVGTAGNIAVTRGRNLAAKGLGLGVGGGLGVFLLGNAKEQVTDTRELYLLIEGPTWATSYSCQVDRGAAARAFAQLVNTMARQNLPPTGTAKNESPANAAGAGDPAVRLTKLAELLEEGLITESDFATEKQRILGEI
jgi:hypothetical protein